jgi:hypothetical protein
MDFSCVQSVWGWDLTLYYIEQLKTYELGEKRYLVDDTILHSQLKRETMKDLIFRF